MLSGNLALIGFIVLTIYIIGMLFIGFYCNRKYTNNLNGFLTGGRSLGPWIFALTYGSTYLSSSTFIGNTGTAYKAGLAYLMMPLAQVVLLPLGLLLFSHGLRRASVRLQAMTIPEYISKRFKSSAAGGIASIVIIIFMVPYMVGVVKGGALSLAQLFGISYGIAVILVSAVACVYLIFGGYMARCYTDVVQGLMMAFGMMAVLIAGFCIIGGPSAISAGVAASDPALLETPGPMGWSNLFLFSTVYALTPWGLPQLVQTNFTIKDRKTVYVSSILLSIWLGAILWGSMIIGNMGRAYYGNAFINNVDAVFPSMVLEFFPNVIGAIVIVAVIAASMSTIDGVLMTSGSAFGVDIYKKFLKKDATDRQVMNVTNIMMFSIMIVVVIWAFNPPEMISLFSTFAFSVIAATLIVPVFGGTYFKSGTRAGCVSAMLAGCFGTLFWYTVKPGGGFILGMPPFVAGAVLSIIVYVIVNKKSEPLPKEFVEDLFSKEAEEDAYAE